MADSDLRRLAFLFGIIGALLLVLAGLIDFVGGFVFLALGAGWHALGAWYRSIVYVVVGFLIGLFSAVGRSGSDDSRIAAGAILIVLSLVGWLGLGFAGELLALLAALFALIGGILFLVPHR